MGKPYQSLRKMLFQKTLFSACALFGVLTVMAPTRPLLAPNGQPTEAAAKTSPEKLAATPPPSDTAVKATKEQTKATNSTKTKSASPKEQHVPYLTPKDRKNLAALLDDPRVKNELSQTIQDKVRAAITPESGTKPTGKIDLTKEESEELRDFMLKYGAEGYFTNAVQKSTQNLLKENAKKLGGQWAFMFTVSLAAMTASGAIAAAAAAG